MSQDSVGLSKSGGMGSSGASCAVRCQPQEVKGGVGRGDSQTAPLVPSGLAPFSRMVKMRKSEGLQRGGKGIDTPWRRRAEPVSTPTARDLCLSLCSNPSSSPLPEHGDTRDPSSQPAGLWSLR